MKFKFTKLAALLLAGVALFGCTDYEVDIQKVDKKVDDLTTGKVATLENQVANLEATVATLESKADHDADIAALNKTISELEKALTEDLDAAKKRIAALEAADEAFKLQIAGIEDTIAGHAQAIELINGEIAQLKTRMDAAEAAIKNINEVLIPALQDQIDNLKNVVIPKIQQDIIDLQTGKLDKAEFNEYKEETAKTLKLMQDSIDALTALTAGEWGVKEDGTPVTIKEYIDALASEFTKKYLELVAKAFGSMQNMKEMEGNLLARLQACEDLLAGDWGDKTVKEYLDGEVKNLQDQIDEINKTLNKHAERIATLEDTVNNTIIPQIQFALDYEGGLQAYIDDAAQQAYEDACAYTDEWVDYIFDFITDLYLTVTSLQQRIQSIVYVPDYDDLKITTNMAYIYQPVEKPCEVGVAVMDEPTMITYKILPAQYATWVAERYETLLEFDVKPVNTRDEEVADTAPRMEIIGYGWDEDVYETGEIVFLVQPVNIASANFAAAGLKPDYEYGLSVDGEPVTGEKYSWPYGSMTTGIFDADNPMPSWWYDDLKVGVWKAEDLKAYQARTAFAASLRMKLYEGGTAIYHYLFDDFDGELDEYVPEYNEVASEYHVLYPAVKEYCILPEVYKKIETEDGDLDVRKFTWDEYHQKLPYSSLRENPVGEKPEQDPKGYRVILDGAVPAVMVDGKPQGLFQERVWNGVHVLQDAEDNYIFIPEFKTEFQKFTFSKFMAIADLDENNFITTPKNEDCPVEVGDYAELEMNPEVPASTRKLAVGNLIAGTYTFTSSIGTFSAMGDVLITKPQGSINLDAEVKWVYKLDSDVDHNIYYNGAPVDSYGRDEVEINIDAEGLARLDKDLGVTLDSFKKHNPDKSTIKVSYVDIDAPEGTEPVELGEDALFSIPSITIKDDKLFAAIKGFEFGKVYTVTATYPLEYADIDVIFTFTTVDRNRETITVVLPEYKFELNGEDYDAASDTYNSKTYEFRKDLFEKFIAQEIINQGDPKDFADADAFVGVDNNGKEGHLVVVPADKLEEGEENSPYIVIGDDNAKFIFTSLELLNASLIRNEDGTFTYGNAQVIYVTTYTGQKVKVFYPLTVDTPAYDFLHLRYYTFNTDKETEGLIAQRNFADNDGTVKWWTQVNPSYFTTVDPNAIPGDASNRISNRHALADYDVAYINLAELAFNVVDPKDDIMDADAMAAAHLVAEFNYTDKTQGAKDLPEVDKILNFVTYDNLWVNPTVFYYRTNEKKFIPAYGSLYIQSGDVKFPINTRFVKEKDSVKFPGEELDYSTYAVVRWTPFQVPPKADGFTIVLDENNIYRVPLFKGMYLKDNRPNGTSYYVLNDGNWVVGDVADPTNASGNGYIKGIKANDAYHITTTFTYDGLKLPTDLQKLLTVEEIDGVPYMVYDYRSQVEFHGVVEIPVTVALTNPWQEAITFEYNVYIKGVND